MRSYLDQRLERTPEILSQVAFPTDYFSMILGLNAASNRFTFELIAMTQILASHVAMVVKHHLACRRPDRVSGLDLPIIQTPGHGSFPSAHATEAFAVSELLRGLLPHIPHHYPDREKRCLLLDKQAERIAVNRTVAGVHFPIDSWAGSSLGIGVARIVLAKCGAAPDPSGFAYKAKDTEFRAVHLRDPDEARRHGLAPLGSFACPPSDLFKWIWNKSVGEFAIGGVP